MSTDLSEFGTPGRKEGGRCTGGKKGGKKKLRKVAGTDIKGCGWRNVLYPPSPLPVRSLALAHSVRNGGNVESSY